MFIAKDHHISVKGSETLPRLERIATITRTTNGR